VSLFVREVHEVRQSHRGQRNSWHSKHNILPHTKKKRRLSLCIDRIWSIGG